MMLQDLVGVRRGATKYRVGHSWLLCILTSLRLDNFAYRSILATRPPRTTSSIALCDLTVKGF